MSEEPGSQSSRILRDRGRAFCCGWRTTRKPSECSICCASAAFGSSLLPAVFENTTTRSCPKTPRQAATASCGIDCKMCQIDGAHSRARISSHDAQRLADAAAHDMAVSTCCPCRARRLESRVRATTQSPVPRRLHRSICEVTIAGSRRAAVHAITHRHIECAARTTATSVEIAARRRRCVCQPSSSFEPCRDIWAQQVSVRSCAGRERDTSRMSECVLPRTVTSRFVCSR